MYRPSGGMVVVVVVGLNNTLKLNFNSSLNTLQLLEPPHILSMEYMNLAQL